jgi:hypothetical protein
MCRYCRPWNRDLKEIVKRCSCVRTGFEAHEMGESGSCERARQGIVACIGHAGREVEAQHGGFQAFDRQRVFDYELGQLQQGRRAASAVALCFPGERQRADYLHEAGEGAILLHIKALEAGVVVLKPAQIHLHGLQEQESVLTAAVGGWPWQGRGLTHSEGANLAMSPCLRFVDARALYLWWAVIGTAAGCRGHQRCSLRVLLGDVEQQAREDGCRQRHCAAGVDAGAGRRCRWAPVIRSRAAPALLAHSAKEDQARVEGEGDGGERERWG